MNGVVRERQGEGLCRRGSDLTGAGDEAGAGVDVESFIDAIKMWE